MITRKKRTRPSTRRSLARVARRSSTSPRRAKRVARLRGRRPGKLVRRGMKSRGRGSRAAAANAHARERVDAQYRALVAAFEAGVLQFQKQNYEKARAVFEKLVSAESVEISSRARTYLRMCEQKLRPTEPQVKGPREHYELGIAYLNARQLDAALECLTKAQKSGPDQDAVQYAMAAVHALKSNPGAALEHLGAAIRLRPANRFLAARDEDFASLAGVTEFQRLIRTESA